MMCGAAGLPVLCMQTGGSWIFGGGLDLTSQMPRYSRMARITDGSSMLLMIRMPTFNSNNSYHAAYLPLTICLIVVTIKP